jgi:hypothetical protein
MKKILIGVIVAVFSVSYAAAQFNKTVGKKKTEPIQTEPVKKIAPPSQPPTPVYAMTAARVSIRTGSDNKEFPSGVYVEVWQKDHPGGANYQAHCLYNIRDLKNEMAINSTTQLGLEKTNGPAEKFLLSTIQQYGLELNVSYLPNFFMDAWKIENITWTLEFRDQNGNPHPTLGNKVISFSNSTGFLNNEYHVMKCFIDQSLNPLVASIVK